VAEMGTDKFNGLGPISVMIALWTCFAYVAMLDRWSSQKTTRAVLIVVWLWIALITARGILEGVGITALLPFIMLIMMAKTRGWNRKRAIVVCGAFALITATAGSAVGDIIRLNRFGPQFDKTTILKQAAAYFQGNSSGSERTGLQEMVTQSAIAAFMKFDSFSGGELLLREGGPGAGGLKSVASSFLAIVPRTLMPDKPVPGSADGTYLGVPARIAGRISGMDPFSTMTGVTPCAIAIWQLGYPNVLLLIVGNVAFLMFLNSLLLTNGFFLRALAIYLIGLPTFWPVFPSPDVVIMNMERALLVYALISVCGSFLGSAKRRQQAARIEEGPDRSLPLPSNGEA